MQQNHQMKPPTSPHKINDQFNTKLSTWSLNHKEMKEREYKRTNFFEYLTNVGQKFCSQVKDQWIFHPYRKEKNPSHGCQSHLPTQNWVSNKSPNNNNQSPNTASSTENYAARFREKNRNHPLCKEFFNILKIALQKCLLCSKQSTFAIEKKFMPQEKMRPLRNWFTATKKNCKRQLLSWPSFNQSFYHYHAFKQKKFNPSIQQFLYVQITSFWIANRASPTRRKMFLFKT